MIDFDALVLGPAMATFAEPCTIWPGGDNVSAFAARGVWSDKPVDIQMQDGMIASGQVRTMGFRISELQQPLVQGDWLIRDRTGDKYIVDDCDDDGQGGTVATLKEAE